MIFNLSGRVEVVLRNGEKIENYCKLPPGFAGDTERENITINKFIREAVPVWGQEKSKRVEKIVMDLDKHSSSDLIVVLRGK